MNLIYFGDSYDLVKRFFCTELSSLGYSVTIDPMFTDAWNGTEKDFFRLIGAEPIIASSPGKNPRALFLDPDKGISNKDGKKHISFQRLANESKKFDLVFSFDQSFSRNEKSASVMHKKLVLLREYGCYGMYYDSHVRFLFVSATMKPLNEFRGHLISLGLPSSRLIESST